MVIQQESNTGLTRHDVQTLGKSVPLVKCLEERIEATTSSTCRTHAQAAATAASVAFPLLHDHGLRLELV
jgi:hypothetical protein